MTEVAEKPRVSRGMTTMYVNPVPRKSAQGRNEYKFVDSLGNVKDWPRTAAAKATKRYSFPANADGRTLRTGLNRQVDNPYYGMKPEELNLSSKWYDQAEDLVKRPSISKQMELEIRFDLDEGTLTSNKTLNYSFKRRSGTEEPTYLETFTIVLEDRPNRFDDTTLEGALAIEMVKSSRKFADDRNSANPSKHDFYISEENEAVNERTSRRDVVHEAIADLVILRRKYPQIYQYKVAVILELVKGEAPEVLVKDALNAYIETQNNQFENIENFNKLFALVSGNRKEADRLHVMYCIKQALNNNIMAIKSGHYTWYSKKGIDNLYDLGTKEERIINMFLTEYQRYDEKNNEENHYADLERELRNKGVRIE